VRVLCASAVRVGVCGVCVCLEVREKYNILQGEPCRQHTDGALRSLNPDREIMTELSAASLAALRAVDTEARAPANLSDEQAAEVITEEMRALFQPPAAASAVHGSMEVEQAQPMELLTVPSDLLSIILSQLETLDLACFAATCSTLWCDGSIPLPQTALPFGLVEAELRRRAEARGLHIDSSLPEGVLSWVPYLLKRDFNDAQRREASLAAGLGHSFFVDRKGRLHHACHRQAIAMGKMGETLLGHDWDSDAGAFKSVPPTLVPSLQDKRIVSVATGSDHCLALSAVGEVYSWGDAGDGVLGHADSSAMAGPRRVEALVQVELISAGPSTSAAVDHRGRLFTWGCASYGLGYELDSATGIQLTPKTVDALSEHRVMGVALGFAFFLAVTDAGVVFSCGHSAHGALGHGLLTSAVMPRRIQALAETGLRFVAVAAGYVHVLALTATGVVYGWGHGDANGHGPDQHTPQWVAALAGQRVKLVYAQGYSSCAVTENGELYTWGRGGSFRLGHGVAARQAMPKRVEALRGVKVAAAAISDSQTLVADTDGAVWGFGNARPSVSAMRTGGLGTM